MNTALQIDMLCKREGEFVVMLTQLGDDFPEWIEDITDICSNIAQVSKFTKKFYTETIAEMKPNETYELLPASEVTNFTPDDFDINWDASHIDFETLPASEVDDLNANYMRTRRVNPEARVVDTGELAHKLSSKPGSMIRTVLRPVSHERSLAVRSDAYAHDQRLQNSLDANSSVVDIRCFVSSTDKVSIGLKRIINAMATDSILSKLSNNEQVIVWKDPMSSVIGFSRLCITASALIRLPALEYALVKEAKSTMSHIESSTKMRQKLKDDIEHDIMHRIEDMISRNNDQMIDIFRENMRELIDESLKESKGPTPSIRDISQLNPDYSPSQELN
ncbi:MAG: hypothetical protein LBC50_01895 [Candidatus Ancillula sp.]|jgi:hypothetical protein|nr:hypothetical protein [Candidatus Ancillula sp.]